ncbi:hypothetical protein TEA_011608 [Camellia sinensis var. sinensis]|uniref:Thioredoxin domain-containing protein n=1 Tax=Camellia sinensis var. sinensis TaxID=542762 RepID=A0A4S4EA96_CAMSN|nr:hypothetical protein TEA_011608 [Camellia sinensis var. sinensis]
MQCKTIMENRQIEVVISFEVVNKEILEKLLPPPASYAVERSSSTSSLGSMQTSSMRTSQVLAFHSPSKWKTHFEASKATSKLDVSQEYGVQAMPTFILIKKGRVVDKVTGVRKEELQNKIEKNRAYHYCS